ncbi:hypothetical protein TNCV_2895471 [Trichonephila clavipes]|nr:hypothetical protein TNCV_2895471 [Trichonephila clavipes]
MADKDILELVQSSKNVLYAACDDENEINKGAHILKSSDLGIMKNMCGYLDTHSTGEMNNKMDDIDQFDAKKRQYNYIPPESGTTNKMHRKSPIPFLPNLPYTIPDSPKFPPHRYKCGREQLTNCQNSGIDPRLQLRK